MKKGITDCCALCQLSSVGNDTSLRSLQIKLHQLNVEMTLNKEVGITTGNGQTAVFVIVSPGEDLLEFRLKSLGFKLSHQFKRRVGYPPGGLKMYIKNLDESI